MVNLKILLLRLIFYNDTTIGRDFGVQASLES